MSIGKLAVVLTADAGGLLKGLGATGKAVKSLADQVAATSSRMTALAGINPTGLMSAFRAGVQDIIKTDMATRRLGVGITEFRTMLVAAGPAADAVSSSVGTLATKVAQVKLGSIDAARSFRTLGALTGETFGLSGKSTFETWGRTLELLAKMPNQARRSVAAFDLLGPAAADLLPELMRGPAGLADAHVTARRLGLAVDDTDLKNIREMQRVFSQIDLFKQGFTNQLAMGISPIIVELNKSLGLMQRLDISGLKTGIMGFAEAAAKLGVGLYEAFSNRAVRTELFGLFGEVMKFAGDKFSEYLLLGVGKLFQAIGKVDFGWGMGHDFGATGQRLLRDSDMHGLRSGFHGMLAGAHWNQMLDAAGASPAMRAVTDFFGRVRGQPQAAPGPGLAGQLAGLMPTPLSLLSGLAGGKSGLAGLLGGVLAPGIAPAGRAIQGMAGPVTPQFAGLLNAQFAGLAGAAKSPAETFMETMKQIQAFQEMGKFAGAGGGDLQARMFGGAFASLQSMVKLPELRQPDAALAGSREAYSAVVTHQRGDRRLTVQEQMKALLAEAKKLQEEQVRIGKEANETLKELVGKEAEEFDF